jgi:hypothetical protein
MIFEHVKNLRPFLYATHCTLTPKSPFAHIIPFSSTFYNKILSRSKAPLFKPHFPSFPASFGLAGGAYVQLSAAAFSGTEQFLWTA